MFEMEIVWISVPTPKKSFRVRDENMGGGRPTDGKHTFVFLALATFLSILPLRLRS